MIMSSVQELITMFTCEIELNILNKGLKIFLFQIISSAESQKGAINIKSCSVENQRGGYRCTSLW